MSVAPEQEREIARLLGREPRGLEAIAVTSADDRPVVIRVASLVEDKPFPTLFWLVDPELRLRIDRAEAIGAIAHLQSQIDADTELQAALRADHLAYIALRDSYCSDELRARVAALGYADALRSRGVGGIADFGRIRCLHTWYAAHLVQPNTVGRMLEQWWAEQDTQE